MLITLCIEQFAIVKHLELDFKQGMTAFTGETGAGKSIMIDALLLALGERADATVVRADQEKCEITAGFYCEPLSEPALWLAEHDLSCTDGEVYLRRVIYAEGRSKSYINGQPFPLQKIKELSEKLVHIHGQHQNQLLMQHITHRQQLDRYANHSSLLEEVNLEYKKTIQIKQEIDRLKNHSQHTDKIQLVEFQLEELSALNLKEGEVQALHREHQMLHHAKDYLEDIQRINDLLSGEEQPDICSLLNQVLQLTQQLPKDQTPIKNAFELINSALIQCEEAVREMEQFSKRIQLDPARLNEVENRMSLIHAMARKYHKDSNALLQFIDALQDELKTMQDAELRLVALQDALIHQTKAYESSALLLRESRKKQAIKLAHEITQRIQCLGMPKGWVTIEITPLDKMQPHGLDKIEYKVCTNPGMAPDSLNKIASGGELSRIGLAIQMITAQKGSTPTLMFDEVDVGIGGATAALVGQMLRQLGERLQVFCVTHQPQVAACAHQHYQVEKLSDNNQTMTKVSLLGEAEKINEIARMLGGLTITEQTKSHARELLLQSN